MLDAYIIERIRQERERRHPGLQPLRIEVPKPREEDDPRWSGRDHKDANDTERGIVNIDFNI